MYRSILAVTLRNAFKFVLISFLLFNQFCQSTAYGQINRLSVTVYEHADFGGRSRSLGIGSHRFYSNTDGDFNDIISSIKIPEGYGVIVYEHANEAGGFGASVDLLENNLNLPNQNFNDRISYFTVFSTNEKGKSYVWSRNAYENEIFVPGHWRRITETGVNSNTKPIVAPPEPARFIVSKPAMLDSVLRSNFVGRVIMPADICFNMTGYAGIPIQPGVQLVGERGSLGSRPCLFTEYFTESYSLFEIRGSNVRVEGIHFIGPANGSRDKIIEPVNAIGIITNPDAGLGRNIRIADNEFNEWPGAGVLATSIHVVKKPSEYTWTKPNPAEARSILIERNYFHHNARNSKGYGVVVGGGCYIAIEGNVFDYNRHSIAAGGEAYSGYFARFNYVLEGGFEEEGYYNQHFDVHGTGEGGYGDPAGKYFEVVLNTFRGEQTYSGVKTRPAFMLRGKPDSAANFVGNVLVHNSHDAAVSLKKEGGLVVFEDHDEFNYHESGNKFNTDYSTELATGDFDGDGRTDIFLANGTAWFYSRAGIQPWEYLHASTKRTKDLGFADINNDGITDVVYRDESNNLGYLKSGKGNLIPLTTSPVPITDLRFADFDGDQLTDIFYTRQNQWQIWYGKNQTWVPAQSSSLPVTEFLFGQFDNNPGADLVAVVNGAWSYSSSCTGSWQRLNSRLINSFSTAVAADFDGNGLADIAYNNGSKWVYSRDGRSSLQDLHKDLGNYKPMPLNKLHIGHFVNYPKVQVICVELKRITPAPVIGNRLVLWSGLNEQQEEILGSFIMHSRQNMR